ncbi:MAG: hypothetical protein KJ941_06050 [Bacteroidetes bacterium]|nr:hypothetical protein [Bacteroidota bacterium]
MTEIKLSNYRLPTKYKIIGYVIFGITTVSSLLAILADYWEKLPDWAFFCISVGLLISSFSNDKVEDEMIRSIRSDSFQLAFYYIFIESAFKTIWSEFDSLFFVYSGPYLILQFLFWQLFFFEFTKKYKL